MTVSRAMELESEWDSQEEGTESPTRNKVVTEDITWEPDPLPLMANHPPRVTSSNTKIQLDREGPSARSDRGEKMTGDGFNYSRNRCYGKK